MESDTDNVTEGNVEIQREKMAAVDTALADQDVQVDSGQWSRDLIVADSGSQDSDKG